IRISGMQRPILILIAVGCLALGLAACGSSSKSSGSTSPTNAPASSSSGGAAGVTIDSSLTFSSTPVKAGSTVTIHNESSSNHTVTADDGSFNVAVNPNDNSATFTAPSKPGTYKFHCNIHSFMHGTLTVN